MIFLLWKDDFKIINGCGIECNIVVLWFCVLICGDLN